MVKTYKVKYGAHIFLWIERWTSRELWLIEKAKKLGLDTLEIAIGDDVEFDAGNIRKIASDEGVEIVISPGGLWPMNTDLSLPVKNNNTIALDWHKRWIEKGAESGATAYTGALYSHPGHIDKRKITEEDIKNSAENLYKLSEFANDHHVKIVLEPMSHFRVSLVNNHIQVMELIKKVGHENLFVLLDTYHLVTEIRDYAEAVKSMAPRLWGIHACENDRGVPGGGLIPWESIFKALKKTGFSGYFILETYNSTIRNGDFAYSRAMFHDVCQDGDKYVKTGTKFLKSNWKK